MRLPALIAAMLIAACTPQQAGDEIAERLPDQAPLDWAYAAGILNAGVMVEQGDPLAPTKFLFDPLYDDHFGSLQKLDDSLIDRIVNGAPPYDRVSAVFVSHAHGDHFSARHLNRMLGAQPELLLVAPEQAVERMRENERWSAEFDTRITAITLENGAESESFEIAGSRIEAFRSPHNGWPDRHAEVHNITYRVSSLSPPPEGSGEAAYHRVMHLGDADPRAEHFEPHSEFLSGARTSLAIVPFWFFREENAPALIGETLNAQGAVGMHVPAKEPKWLAGSGWDYFTGEGQKVEISETE